MLKRQIAAVAFPLIGLLMCSSLGCNAMLNGWLDPSQVGRFRGPAVTQELRRSISIADEPELYLQGGEPTPDDLVVPATDYVLQAADFVDLNVYELMFPGQPWYQTRQISNGGFITIPQVKDRIRAAGLTALELEEHLKQILIEQQILTQPEVAVLVREARGRTYNILGAVRVPRSEVIPRPDYRLIDALAAAGGVTVQDSFNVREPTIKTVYVFRSEPEIKPEPPVPAPRSEPQPPPAFSSVAQTQPEAPTGHWVWVNGEWKFVASAPAATLPAESATAPAVESPLEREPRMEPEAELPLTPEEEIWERLVAQMPSQRVLAIPLERLQEGDPRYNVVIRDKDTIWVPAPLVGEYYVMGNIYRPGVYGLNGRDVSLRQAIAAAGGLSPLADPTRLELIRRIGPDQEQIVQVNLDRIFAGMEQDVFLKPDDIINVGTNPVMPFLAVLRNAFRATYGFGFIYDRNFADIDSFEGQTNPTDRRRSEQRTRFGFGL
ncbi:MAG: hypothetical protein GXY33_06800 [Phycisphaerae bacterium]|nr:hypothetical protein [Phycisphaerae bacterium]